MWDGRSGTNERGVHPLKRIQSNSERVQMSFHHDPSSWLFQAQRENCPYCRKDEDPMQSVTLKFFKYSELCAHPRVSLKGTCYLITREHSVELFDLKR